MADAGPLMRLATKASVAVALILVFGVTRLVAGAVPIGLGVERTRNLGLSSGYATAAIAGFYAVRNIGAVLSLQGVLPPGVAALGLLGALGGLAALALARAPR